MLILRTSSGSVNQLVDRAVEREPEVVEPHGFETGLLERGSGQTAQQLEEDEVRHVPHVF